MGKQKTGLIWAFFLLVAAFGEVLNVPLVKSSETIYIRADGSVDPPTASISRIGNVTYAFTDNIADSIVIERSHIIVDGNGHILQGNGDGTGFSLYGLSNVTIRNTYIKGFEIGFLLDDSHNNTITNNTITDNIKGIHWLDSSGNTFLDTNMTNNVYNFMFNPASHDLSALDNLVDTSNTVDGRPIYYIKGVKDTIYDATTNAGTFYLINCDNITVKDLTLRNNGQGIFFFNTSNSRVENVTLLHNFYGIHLIGADKNLISRNTISYNQHGIMLMSNYTTVSDNTISYITYVGIGLAGFYNTISGNTITTTSLGGIGVRIGLPSNFNRLYLNNFHNNIQVLDDYGQANFWDDGQERGNYWSDYTDKYPQAMEANDSGIWDTPYVIDENNKDNYPLIHPVRRFDPMVDGFNFDNKEISKETISFWDAYGNISSADWSSSIPTEYLAFLAWLAVAVHNLEFGNCFGMSYTAKYHYEKPSLFASKYLGHNDMHSVDMGTASPEILTNQFPGQVVIPPYLLNLAIMYLGLGSLNEQVPWIINQLDNYEVVQLYVDVTTLDTVFPHSVLVYDYGSTGNLVTLQVYDPNYSNNTRNIILSIDEHGNYTIQGGDLVSKYGVTQIQAGEFYDIPWPLVSENLDELIQLVFDIVTKACDDFLGFEAMSPVNILVTAPNGSKVGYDSSSQSEVNELAGATYSGVESEPQTILIPSPMLGEYAIEVFGTGTGDYEIAITSMPPNGTMVEPLTLSGKASEGKLDTHLIELKHDYTIVVLSLPPRPSSLEWLAILLVIAIVGTSGLFLYRKRKASAKP